MSKQPVNYGVFEMYPTRFTPYEAWVFIDDKWRTFDSGEVFTQARVLTEAEFKKTFGQVPELPSSAFA